MAWTCDVSIEDKVRQDCYNRGYEQGRKNPAEEFWAGVEKLQKQVKEYQDKIEQGKLIEFPRIDTYVCYYSGLEKYIVQWVDNGIIKNKTFWDKKKAEKRLKELQNG